MLSTSIIYSDKINTNMINPIYLDILANILNNTLLLS